MSRQRGTNHPSKDTLIRRVGGSDEKAHGYLSLPGQLIGIFLNLLLISGMVLSVVILLILQLFLLPVYPFYPRLMMDACSICASWAWSWMNRIYYQAGNGRIVLTGDEDIPEGESALVISNHISFVDFFPISILAERKQMLGFTRYFAKKSVRYIPLFGWAMYLSGMPMLARNWERDKGKIRAVFDLFRTLVYPAWLVSFVEGSRYNVTKIGHSQEYAKKMGYEVTEWVQIPRSKGFIASLKGIHRTHITHIYDVTLAYYHEERGWFHAPSLFDLLTANLSKFIIHIHIERIAVKDVPRQREEDTAAWLRERYLHKDILLKTLKQAYEQNQDVRKIVGKMRQD